MSQFSSEMGDNLGTASTVSDTKLSLVNNKDNLRPDVYSIHAENSGFY